MDPCGMREIQIECPSRAFRSWADREGVRQARQPTRKVKPSDVQQAPMANATRARLRRKVLARIRELESKEAAPTLFA